MKIENDTNYSKAEIRRFIAMARPPGTKIKLVIVRYCAKHGSGHGRAFTGLGRCKIKVWVPRKSSKHVRKVWKPRKAYLGMAIGSRDECLLMLLAHELRHLWQGQGTGSRARKVFSTEKPRPRKGMVYGARGRFSERDADAWALHRLRQYRRGELS